ncbi:MAG: hypothetical protein K8J08_19055 [Thermoanaerobaculia bacterium]|nr:hypothetical protein [Thermoanaerobaculia bacterium]
MTRTTRNLVDLFHLTLNRKENAMKKLTTVLTSLFVLGLLPATGSSQLVPTFTEIADVASVNCAMVEGPQTSPQQQCTVTLSARTQQRTAVPILCLDEMVSVCSGLQPGNPAMIFGTDHWSFRLAHHVGIEIQANKTLTANQPTHEIPRTISTARASMGDTVTFGKTTRWAQELRLRFSAVPEDTRCPIDVHCVWAGSATVELEAEQGNSSLGTYSIQVTAGVSQYQEIGSYRVRIVNLAPDREQGVTIDPKEYSIVVEALWFTD